MILLNYGLIWTRTVREEAFWKLWRHEYDVIGHVRSSGSSPFCSPPSLSYRLPIVTYPLSPLVSEIFDLKFADTQTNKHTHRQNSTLTDNKGPLKVSAREPIINGPSKLWHYTTGISGSDLSWLTSYLTNRHKLSKLAKHIPIQQLQYPYVYVFGGLYFFQSIFH